MGKEGMRKTEEKKDTKVRGKGETRNIGNGRKKEECLRERKLKEENNNRRNEKCGREGVIKKKRGRANEKLDRWV